MANITLEKFKTYIDDYLENNEDITLIGIGRDTYHNIVRFEDKKKLYLDVRRYELDLSGFHEDTCEGEMFDYLYIPVKDFQLPTDRELTYEEKKAYGIIDRRW